MGNGHILNAFIFLFFSPQWLYFLFYVLASIFFCSFFFLFSAARHRLSFAMMLGWHRSQIHPFAPMLLLATAMCELMRLRWMAGAAARNHTKHSYIYYMKILFAGWIWVLVGLFMCYDVYMFCESVGEDTFAMREWKSSPMLCGRIQSMQNEDDDEWLVELRSLSFVIVQLFSRS